MGTLERLLSDAEQSAEGRKALAFIQNDLGLLGTEAADAKMSAYKFMRDEGVSCAELASDTELEREVWKNIWDARQSIARARELLTAAYIAALRESGRIP